MWPGFSPRHSQPRDVVRTKMRDARCLSRSPQGDPERGRHLPARACEAQAAGPGDAGRVTTLCSKRRRGRVRPAPRGAQGPQGRLSSERRRGRSPQARPPRRGLGSNRALKRPGGPRPETVPSRAVSFLMRPQRLGNCCDFQVWSLRPGRLRPRLRVHGDRDDHGGAGKMGRGRPGERRGGGGEPGRPLSPVNHRLYQPVLQKVTGQNLLQQKTRIHSLSQ